MSPDLSLNVFSWWAASLFVMKLITKQQFNVCDVFLCMYRSACRPACVCTYT